MAAGDPADGRAGDPAGDPAADPARDPAAARVAAALGPWRDRVARYGLAAGAVLALAWVAHAVSIVVQVNAEGFDGAAIRLEFVSFWAAAKLLLAGEAVSAFDPDVLRAAQSLASDAPPGDLLWHYGAAFHLMIAPFGLLPFSVGYIVFVLVSWSAFALAVRGPARVIPGGFGWVALGPAVFIACMLGINSVLWAAGLVAAVLALRARREVAAGLLIALLTLKPQLGLLVPFSLAAGGHWRAVLWAVIGTMVVNGAGWAVLGLDHFEQFLLWLANVSELMDRGLVRFGRMMTWAAVLRLGGVEPGPVMAVQVAFSLAAAGAIAWVWTRRRADGAPLWDLRAAALLIATPLATPYAYHYEMIVSLAGLMFLVRDGFGARPWERVLLVLLWLGPLPGIALLELVPPAVYAAPLQTLGLAVCVWRARR